ncbi:MAG: permease [Candidatus Omnitrophica bacterium]|nr:permease [Candidatus Omnitrophota bacterium]
MLRIIAEGIVYRLLGLSHESKLASAVEFFIYDSLKIFVLLFALIAVIGFMRTYVKQDKIKKWLSGKGILANFYAALFGAVTPFCSCSSIPLFMGFIKGGIPLGVAFSFLITSPLINEYLVVLMLGFFGVKITVLYVLTGMLLGIFSGLIIGKMNLGGNLVQGFVSGEKEDVVDYSTLKERAFYGLSEAIGIIKKIWVWVLAGVGVGAFIHNYIPQEAVQAAIGRTGIFSVPIAVLLGVPMYGSCAAIVPVAVVLFNKGVPLGTALSFMMAIAALSLPEAIMLRRVMNLSLIAIFFGITALGIIFIGYLFNLLQIIV